MRGPASILCIALALVPASASAASPELPRTTVDTTYAPPTGNVISVAAGDDLQKALDAAQPGDTVELAAGATFTGNFTLAAKSGTGWIYVRSSAIAKLPAPGTRVQPSDAANMAAIVSPNTSPALMTDFGAHHWRFAGVEVATTWSSTTGTHYNLISLGNDLNGNLATQASQLPHDLVFDRCFIHGTATGNVRRGILLNAGATAVVDSWLSDFHEVGADSQAIGCFNGTGPFKIEDCELEGSGENVIFGGSDPAIANLVPADIEVLRNHFAKPLSWRQGDPSYAGTPWSEKNLLEFKNAQRVRVEGNVFEYCWGMAQTGFAILFTVRNQDGNAPWCSVNDVTFRSNVVRHSASAINVSGTDDLNPSAETQRIAIANNLLEDIDGGAWNGAGRLFQVLNVASPGSTPGGTVDVTIDHNTGRVSGSAFVALGDSMAAGDQHQGFTFTNNVVEHATYGCFGSGESDGLKSLDVYCAAGYVFTANAIFGGGSAASYPAGNFLPATLADVGFVDAANGDYHLASTSPYKSAGTDGKDLGCDIDVLNQALAQATSAAPAPAPSPSPSPSPAVATPSAPASSPSQTATPASTAQTASAGSGSSGGGGGCELEASAPASWWPLALALGVLAIRRRR